MSRERDVTLEATKIARQTAKLPGFESPWPVAVSQIADGWELTARLRFRARDGREFVVPVGATTDFASIPSFLTWLVSTTTAIAAAVLHDYFWRVLVPQGLMTHRDADNILYEALRSLGVSKVRASTMWAAVRLGALTQPGGRKRWHKDALAVLGISLLMLPLLAVGLALVPIAAVYKLVEWVIG